MKNLKLTLALVIVTLVAFSCGLKKTGQNQAIRKAFAGLIK